MSNFDTFKSNTLLIVAIVAISLKEVITSRKAEVLVNESTFITCFSTKVKKIQWHHTPPGKSNKYVYAGGNFYHPYNTGRFQVDNNLTANMYTLVITNIMLEDAGLYECKDDVESGVFDSTHLTVLDSSPVCSSNMNPNGFVGPNTCNIEQENMSFSCAVSFSGNSPNLTWSTLNGSQALNSSICESKDNRINCSLSMKADPSFDGSTFICQTTTSKDARYNCSIEDMRVEYFFGDYEAAEKRVDDNATCVVASNLQIHYNWTLQHNIYSPNRTIYFQKPGFYVCSVKYNIRNITCNATIVDVNVSRIVDGKETVAKSFDITVEQISVSIGVSTVVMCLVSVIALLTYKNRIKAHSKIAAEEVLKSLNLEGINTDFDLDILLSKGMLGRKEYQEIKSRPTSYDRNVRLLEIVMGKGKLVKLCEAFSPKQKHLVNSVAVNADEESTEVITGESVEESEEEELPQVSDVPSTSVSAEGGSLHQQAQQMLGISEADKLRKTLDLPSTSVPMHAFTKCLRKTDQDVVANVAEKGGATVEIKIILEAIENSADIENEIVTKLTQLQKNVFPKSEDLGRLLSQLKIGGMEILSAHYDEGIAVRIWCRLESTVAKLEQLSNDKKLGNLFSALFRCLPVSTVSKISEIKWHRFPLAVSNRKFCEWSVKTSANMTGQIISEIAMLGSKIIIAFQNRSALMMFTFDKEGNAVFEREETFKKIETPMHMASSFNLRCLYITDRSNSTIRKATFDFEGKVDEPIVWLPGSLTEQINSLSVGRNDNLIVLKEGKPCRLEIYDKEARKLNHLELPTQIRYPNNAVEASNGDFVISYRAYKCRDRADKKVPGGICRINNKGAWVSRLDLNFKCRPIQGLSEDENSVVSSLSEGIPYLKHLDHFTLDNEDQVYACAADQYVVLLDSELNMKEAIEINDLKNPYRIHYLNDKKELLLVHGAGQDRFSLLCSK